jgi:hypothetical protein
MPYQQSISVANLLGGSLLEVPDYQRSFAWTRDQLSDLWSDLSNMVDAGDESVAHFLGTVILKPLNQHWRPSVYTAAHGSKNVGLSASTPWNLLQTDLPSTGSKRNVSC